MSKGNPMVIVRFPPEEKAAYEQTAEATGVTLSDWMREAARAAYKKHLRKAA